MSVINSVLKIELEDKNEVFLVCKFQPSNSLHLTILDLMKGVAYRGSARDVDFRSQAAIIKMVFDSFMSLTKSALTKKEVDDCKFVYCLEKNCESFIFKWKSIDSEETIINIGSLKVTEYDFGSATKDILLLLSDELSNLNTKVQVMDKDLQVMKKEKEDALKLAASMADVKDKIEKELLSKFILVLNEKKRKIRELKESNHNISHDVVSTTKRTKVSKPKRIHQISDSSDESDSNSNQMKVAGPSTSKSNTSLPFFDDNEEILIPSPSKKRNRNPHANFIADIREKKSVESSFVKKEIEIEDEDEDELFKFL